ncbi:hypothetical protein SEA_SMEADLEY_80 [Mycobacterium phage Smeadley]|uniref:Gp68-like predicted RNA polymerase component domain-containing protein n=1 Tax=Mycobacterium phage Smeadley TaxID=1673873 RepID=A0A0H4TH77_9CAUD|nr:hypothetical protein AVT31_gp027 [Mycobacterium phage Smeadley]AKQ07648.1 hypothetical protein SEA_SMEADLEY_80 [Mycobacterium phage Smeadley]
MTTKTPDDINPNDPLLKADDAPHETAAVMRMHRAGFTPTETRRTLKYSGIGTRLQRELEQAIESESVAHRAGREIHDDGLTIKQAREYLAEVEK